LGSASPRESAAFDPIRLKAANFILPLQSILAHSRFVNSFNRLGGFHVLSVSVLFSLIHSELLIRVDGSIHSNLPPRPCGYSGAGCGQPPSAVIDTRLPRI
jgi:hypothetical protein